MLASYKPLTQKKELWCYVRSYFTVVRVIIDTVSMVFAVFWSAFGGWPREWRMISKLMWRQSHTALIIFEVGLHPPDFSLSHVVCLERLHLLVYRTLTVWSIMADAGVIVDVSRDLHTHGENQYAEKLGIACTVAAMSLWRFAEVFSLLSEMVVHRTEHSLEPKT